MKNYGKETQKGKVIQIMILKGKQSYEDFECEKMTRFFHPDIFVGNNAGARLSQLLKDGVVTAEYFENEKARYSGTAKKARYSLTEEAKQHYKELYNLIK